MAEHLGVPVEIAEGVAGPVRRGIISSQLGRGGGYRLNRKAEQVSLLEVIEAIDGPIDAEVPLAPQAMHEAGMERLYSVCQRIADVRGQLAATSVAGMWWR